MNISVSFFGDAASFSAAAGEFLRSQPVTHNLILTLLHGQLKRSESGRYWLATRDGESVGVVVQSSPERSALLVPIDPDAIAALVDAIADAGIALPGASGEAATASSFAGQWTERCKTGAVPTQGLRLYELGELKLIAPVEGCPRKAEPSDREQVIHWLQGFQAEVHEPLLRDKIERQADARIAAGLAWLWQNSDPVSMAASSVPMEGVIRMQSVYTPPENRKRGYGTVCAHAMSKHFADQGYRCILYTDLGNSTSNSIYRRIGYTAVSELIRYRFD